MQRVVFPVRTNVGRRCAHAGEIKTGRPTECVQANDLDRDHGLGVGDVREVVMRDRISLAEDGMFVIVAVVDRKTGKVRGEPDIISRGFVYLRESGHIIAGARKRVKEIVEQAAKAKPIDDKHIRESIREELGKFFFEKTQRRPMVLPVIIEV